MAHRSDFIMIALALLAAAQVLAAPPPSPAPPSPASIETPLEALAHDAAEYAKLHPVTPVEAILRLQAQEASVAYTDALRGRYQDRLAGLFLEHEPAFRIVFLLTGDTPIAETSITVAGIVVPIVFRTGAPATRDRILAAIAAHQAAIRAALPSPPGMGVNPRTGRLLILVRAQDLDGGDPVATAARIEAIAGVPVEVRSWAEADADLAVEGGARVTGRDASGRRFVCTSGFVVTDGARTALTTAAHCPDNLSFIDGDKSEVPLPMLGAWGARYQDVQIHAAPQPLAPLFHADSKTQTRALTSWRNRESTRAGDIVCHRGERTDYSCAEVAFVDYAPPGDLCAGPCTPTWVAVKGPACKSGDSGGPVFLGTIAFGIVKGDSMTADGTCRLYYYMSTDYLPPGWTLSR